MGRAHWVLSGALLGVGACNAILDNEEPQLLLGGAGSAGSSGSNVSSGAGGKNAGTGGVAMTGSGGVNATGGNGGGQGVGGASGVGGMGGSAGKSGAGGMSGAAGTAGNTTPDSGVTQPDSGSTTLHSGPFKLLVLSKALEFAHDSIPNGLQMLVELGNTTDASLPPGAQPGSQFTVTVAKDDLTDFTDANLGQYEILFWLQSTGTVFTSNANGVTAKAAVQKFMEQRQGAWAGVHSGLDFEKTGQWPWFQDLVGASTVSHTVDGTPGPVLISPSAIALDHPAVRGIPTSWNCSDEWWSFSRDPASLPGFLLLGTLQLDGRPVSWVHEIAGAGGGRAFYTSRGHNKTVYAEPDFRKHVHQGILWAVRRMK